MPTDSETAGAVRVGHGTPTIGYPLPVKTENCMPFYVILHKTDVVC